MSEQKRLIDIAKIALRKGYDMETLNDSDYIYGEDMDVEEVWEYVIECQEIGTIAFDKKYNL